MNSVIDINILKKCNLAITPFDRLSLLRNINKRITTSFWNSPVLLPFWQYCNPIKMELKAQWKLSTFCDPLVIMSDINYYKYRCYIIFKGIRNLIKIYIYINCVAQYLLKSFWSSSINILTINLGNICWYIL